ncbi:Wadjet anti-phage system protein JetA family protein [Desulfallas thermosapovorans]|uniref:TIGR02677 family protein n=1 Tax=Desulfallas thermosapovorans DSM 6562 TaxID=1121431 RepID=A0A5S4ZQ24_9FIRM|nr:Wadjet anti-phage system protein JetA family protein [Desulfallas thermosapovorans]TYO94784.1 hypothetical protein LX24_02035 [Desulfallas thermosapovorans DSM 6562]
MRLFDVIPEKLFSVLASPLKEDYAAILFKIYEQYLMTTFGIEREVLVDLIVDYIEEKEENDTFGQALEEEIWEESMDNPAGARGRAGFVLRKLETTGWLAVETYSDYKQYVTLNDYAIRILETLEKIRENRQAEYQGFVFATYTLLHSAEADRQGNLALEKAYEQTEQLINGLKSLNHNIKRYIERVLSHKSPAEILRMHFEDYKREIIDRSYHRLKTSDNVSRYRPRIIKKINGWMGDDAWVKKAADLDVRRERYPDRDAALRELYRKMDYIRQSYLTMDNLLEEIDRRNVQYANASFLQLKYMLNSSKNAEGMMMDILAYLARLRAEKRAGDPLPGHLEPLYSIFTQGYLDNGSLFTARENSKNHQPVAMDAVEGPGAEQKARRLAHYKEMLARRLTRERINDYVLDKLGDRADITAAELGVREAEDFLKLIYVAAYAPSRLAKYKVDFSTPERVTTGDGFNFKNIRISRK